MMPLITSISNFIEEIIKIRNKRSTSDAYPDIWFRGIKDEGMELLPGAYWRKDCEEFSLAATFRALSPLLLSPKPETDWDWYYCMQHYGIPTRLLDWSESPLQALHFALPDKIDANPCVWVLDPAELNLITQGHKIIYIPEAFNLHKNLEAWLPHRCGKAATISKFADNGYLTSNEKPIAIYPSRSNPRLFSQRGTFTVHGTAAIPLEKIFDPGSPHLIKLTIDKNKVDELRNDLWALGFTKSTTYPEPENVALDVKLLYGIKN